MLFVLLAVAVVAAAGTAALILSGLAVPAGVSAAIAGGALILAGVRVDEAAPTRLTFLDAVAERAVDAVILGAVAWASLPQEIGTAAAALAALVAGYLAFYLRAKATGLGFPIAEPPLARPARVAFVVAALFLPGVRGAALWVAAAISGQSMLREAATVARLRHER
jgi:hypothetical protein